MNLRYLLSIVLCISFCDAVPRINLFKPTDRPLLPEPISDWSRQLSVSYEGAFHIRAFRDTEEFQLQIDLDRISSLKKKTELFSLFQPFQNALAACKGADSDTPSGGLVQQFNLDEHARGNGRFHPDGKLSIPLNLLFAQRFYFSHGLSLGFYLPLIHAELKDVSWRNLSEQSTQEEVFGENLIHRVEKIVQMNLLGWKRTGVGDLVIQVDWMRDFPQRRNLLSHVRTLARIGAIVPTGKRADEDRFFAFPFGSDGAWGVQFAGGIDLTFGYTLRGGIDVQFDYLFGNTRCRRIKTIEGQTDLLLTDLSTVYLENGLGQQYNIYLESSNFWRNTSCKLNYQLLKQNDSRIDIGSDRIDTQVANSAEYLFDWTAHSLIFMVHHDIGRDYQSSSICPSLLGWIKWGFNGKRALLANTVGLQLNVSF